MVVQYRLLSAFCCDETFIVLSAIRHVASHETRCRRGTFA
jgi:hypothetical protein